MSEASLQAKIVRVHIRDGHNGLFYAYSDDIRGLVVAESSHDEVVRAIPPAIQEMYAACGEHIIVVPAERGNELEFVKIPTSMARDALQAESA